MVGFHSLPGAFTLLAAVAMEGVVAEHFPPKFLLLNTQKQQFRCDAPEKSWEDAMRTMRPELEKLELLSRQAAHAAGPHTRGKVQADMSVIQKTMQGRLGNYGFESVGGGTYGIVYKKTITGVNENGQAAPTPVAVKNFRRPGPDSKSDFCEEAHMVWGFEVDYSDNDPLESKEPKFRKEACGSFRKHSYQDWSTGYGDAAQDFYWDGGLNGRLRMTKEVFGLAQKLRKVWRTLQNSKKYGLTALNHDHARSRIPTVNKYGVENGFLSRRSVSGVNPDAAISLADAAVSRSDPVLRQKQEELSKEVELTTKELEKNGFRVLSFHEAEYEEAVNKASISRRLASSRGSTALRIAPTPTLRAHLDLQAQMRDSYISFYLSFSPQWRLMESNFIAGTLDDLIGSRNSECKQGAGSEKLHFLCLKLYEAVGTRLVIGLGEMNLRGLRSNDLKPGNVLFPAKEWRLLVTEFLAQYPSRTGPALLNEVRSSVKRNPGLYTGVPGRAGMAPCEIREHIQRNFPGYNLGVGSDRGHSTATATSTSGVVGGNKFILDSDGKRVFLPGSAHLSFDAVPGANRHVISSRASMRAPYRTRIDIGPRQSVQPRNFAVSSRVTTCTTDAGAIGEPDMFMSSELEEHWTRRVTDVANGMRITDFGLLTDLDTHHSLGTRMYHNNNEHLRRSSISVHKESRGGPQEVALRHVQHLEDFAADPVTSKPVPHGHDYYSIALILLEMVCQTRLPDEKTTGRSIRHIIPCFETPTSATCRCGAYPRLPLSTAWMDVFKKTLKQGGGELAGFEPVKRALCEAKAWDPSANKEYQC